MSANDTHAHFHRSWTNQDYQIFADGTPDKVEHRVQSQHNAHIHVKDGKVERVHCANKAFLDLPMVILEQKIARVLKAKSKILKCQQRDLANRR